MRRRNVLLALLALGLGISLVWGYNQYSIAQELTIRQENQYQQAYRDMTDHVGTLENFFAKTLGSGSNSNNLIHLTGAWNEANAALNDLSNLPVENPGSNYIAQFLNQASDFSYTLAQRIAGGGNIKPEEHKVLVTLHETSRKTSEDLNNLLAKVDYEDLTWTGKKPTMWGRLFGWFIGRAEADTSDAAQPASVAKGMQIMDSELQKLPPLEYNGQYGGKVTKPPKGLPATEVTQEQAKDKVSQFFNKVGINYNVQYQGEAQGLMPTFTFNANGTTATVEVTKKGGVIASFDDSREIGERVISPEQAKAKASNYLRALDYPTMYLTSTEDYGSYLNLSYVVQEDGVRIYPDKVIIKIAMDNGQLIGYNAKAYLFFHHKRSIGKAKLSVTQARRYLRPNFKVTDTALVLLAKDDYSEVFCYEFRGTVDSEEYLIYINVSSGFEEQMFRVIKTPEGEFLQ